MQKCRLCLKHSKKLECIFDNAIIEGISYAVIINSVANVKVSKCDGLTDQICLACRRKTKEVWDFKLQIERSYMALQENCSLKRVCFSNINETELPKEIAVQDLNKTIRMDFTKNLVDNCDEPFNYNDTVIQKVQCNEKKLLTVLDFLNSINDESENYQDDFKYEVIEYDPDSDDCNLQEPLSKRITRRNKNKDYDKDDPDYKNCLTFVKKLKNKSSKMKKTASRKGKENKIVLRTPIQPVLLEDYRIEQVRNKSPKKHKTRADKAALICPYCGKITKTFEVHLLTHSSEKPFECHKCPSTFALLPQLERHMKTVHGPKVFKCGHCSAAFPTTAQLKTHSITHSSEKKHICKICNKSFKLATHLTRHIRLLHNFGVKPVKCELCPDTFNSNFQLKHHMRVHTGERPYRCEICSQPYSYKHDFNRHCLKKHGVWFKRRTVYVMNEEVLAQEKVLMRDLMLRVNGILKDDKPLNPFEGPQAALAFDMMIKAIQSGKVVVDLQL